MSSEKKNKLSDDKEDKESCKTNSSSGRLVEQLSVETENIQIKTQPKLRNKKIKEKEDYDILQVDNQIKVCFNIEKAKIPEYKTRLASMLNILVSVETPFGVDEKIIEDIQSTALNQTEEIKDEVFLSLNYREYLEFYDVFKKLQKKIHNIESGELYSKYILLSEPIVEEYKKILSVPIKTSFLSKSKKDDNSVRKSELKEIFLKIASNFIDIDYIPETPQTKKYVCKCGNSTDFSYDEGTMTCETEGCGIQVSIQSSQSSFKDTDRINLHKKYKYEKKTHFKEGIIQYQGKQNKYIDPAIDEKANEWFIRHNLLNMDAKTKEERYAKVQKEHLKLFMSESGDREITKHYEDITKLYSRITGKPCPNISHLQDKLIEQFDLFEESFLAPEVQNKLAMEGLDRTNILNGQFMLKKLLIHNGFKPDPNDFPGLKTSSRQNDHEDIYRIVAEHCGLLDQNL